MKNGSSVPDRNFQVTSGPEYRFHVVSISGVFLPESARTPSPGLLLA
jgi:hypothetical protein